MSIHTDRPIKASLIMTPAECDAYCISKPHGMIRSAADLRAWFCLSYGGDTSRSSSCDQDVQSIDPGGFLHAGVCGHPLHPASSSAYQQCCPSCKLSLHLFFLSRLAVATRELEQKETVKDHDENWRRLSEASSNAKLDFVSEVEAIRLQAQCEEAWAMKAHWEHSIEMIIFIHNNTRSAGQAYASVQNELLDGWIEKQSEAKVREKKSVSFAHDTEFSSNRPYASKSSTDITNRHRPSNGHEPIDTNIKYNDGYDIEQMKVYTTVHPDIFHFLMTNVENLRGLRSEGPVASHPAWMQMRIALDKEIIRQALPLVNNALFLFEGRNVKEFALLQIEEECRVIHHMVEFS
jgi:hypothetical protein